MDISIIADNLPIYLEGLKNTLIMMLASLVIGLLAAIPLAILRTSKNLFIQLPIRAFVYFFRGTPLLVQLYIVYYGFGQFDIFKQSIFWPLFREAYFCAIFTFALNTCAYTIEIIRGSIIATPHGEIEAALAAGMSRFTMFRRIILPSAFRRALPAYGNEIIFTLHGTAMASVITIIDITGAAHLVKNRYYSTYEAFMAAAILYMAITFVLVFFIKKLEKRWNAHLKPQTEEPPVIEAPVIEAPPQ
ncbi:MAG: amino acid ABC transporter permease [Deltaproteobacteria bacterium]|nr:MAG: amino acid ABC transporter permease [Deltaproteobacteria bacterium]